MKGVIMKHNNWFWGIFFVLAAVFVIAGSVTTLFAQIGFWSILAAVFLAAVFIQSLIHLNYFGVFVSLALAYWIFQQPLNLYIISPWLLILAAVLLSIGFYTIFHKQTKYKYTHRSDKDDEYRTVEEIDDNNPYVRVSFGASSKYLHADALKGGQFYCKCGALEVYFDQVQLDPNGAEIYVDCSLGEIKLYFPKTWRIINRLHGSLSGINDESYRSKPEPDAPQIVLTGNVSLGAAEINYV
jgi:predicted membrane protein